MDWQTIISIYMQLRRWWRQPPKWLYESYFRYIKKQDFMFRRYSKEVRIFPNGNGIVTTKMMIKILNREKFKKIRRNLNINDAAKSAGFDKWERMVSRNREDRYSKVGIWWDGNSEVKKAIPLYNSDRKNSRHLHWNFIFDDSKIRRDKISIINLSYGISIPHMYPIKNGKKDIANFPYANYEYKTSLKIDHKATLLRYNITMDKEMELFESPEFRLYNKHDEERNGKGKPLDIDDQSTIFLHQYNTSITQPKSGQRIQCKWKMM